MRKALQSFGILDDSDIEWLASAGKVRFIPDGATLVEEATQLNEVFILIEGALEVVLLSGKRVHIATLLPGEVIGEISFVDGRAASASVIATHDSHVFAIPHQEVVQKLAIDPSFASRFYRAIASFLADRLAVTVSRFGYGSHSQDIDPDALNDGQMEVISIGAQRFDMLLKHLRRTHPSGSFASSTSSFMV